MYPNFDFCATNQIGDQTGQAAAKMNLNDIRRALGLPPNPEDLEAMPAQAVIRARNRRRSMEKMDLLKVRQSLSSPLY